MHCTVVSSLVIDDPLGGVKRIVAVKGMGQCIGVGQTANKGMRYCRPPRLWENLIIEHAN